MSPNQSAGILLYKIHNGQLMLFLVHPGGPLWERKDEGVWSIPKGEFAKNEIAFDAAMREFEEETGQSLHFDQAIELTPITQKSGKIVHAWAIEGDIDATKINSNEFELEWPPKSGKKKSFPEIDKGEWFTVEKAKLKINPAQAELIDQLVDKLNESSAQNQA